MTSKSLAILTHQYVIDEVQDGTPRAKKMRTIEVKSKSGKPISVLQSEDNPAAIEEVLRGNGWQIVSWAGEVASITPVKATISNSSNAAAAPNTKGCAIGCLSIVVIIAILTVISVLTSSGEDSPPSTYPSEIACQDAILSKLNAPSTAEFSQGKIRTTSPEPDLTYVIVGFVESENKLGGIVGSNYRCTVKVPTEGDPLVTDSELIS